MTLYLQAKPANRHLPPLLDHFGRTKVAAITPPLVRRAARLLYPDARPATWNRQVVTPVRAVINFAAEDGRCDHFRMKRFAEGDRKARPPGSKQWLAAFQRQARKQGHDRLAALARLMFETGARIGQACDLTWADVDLGQKAAILRTRKTGPHGAEISERIAFLTPTMVVEIANLSGLHPRKVFGYPNRHSVYGTWASVVAAAKIPPLTPHEAGRHGFATEMIVRAGKDLRTTADRGGWKSIRLMLDTYAHEQDGRDTIDDVFGETRGRKPARRAAGNRNKA